METNDWMLLLAVIAVFSAIFSVLCAIALTYFRDFRISRLEKAVDSMYHSNAAAMSASSRQEKAERQEAAMLAFASAMQKPDAKIADVLKEVGAQYPDVAMNLIKKAGLKI